MKRASVSTDTSLTKRPKKATKVPSNASELLKEKIIKSKSPVFNDVDKAFLTSSGAKWRIFDEDELPGAQVYYLPDLIDEHLANQWLAELKELETWYQPILKVYGRNVTQSRAISAYTTTPDLTVKYSGQTIDMHYPYPELLSRIQAKVEAALGLNIQETEDANEGSRRDYSPSLQGFNHVMLNRYDDGSVYIGKHSDNKENKVIASLSLGAPRTFVMSPRKGEKGEIKKWSLANGSLLIMQGDTQANWKHEIPRESKVKDCRISLTFRQVEF